MHTMLSADYRVSESADNRVYSCRYFMLSADSETVSAYFVVSRLRNSESADNIACICRYTWAMLMLAFMTEEKQKSTV